MPDMLKKIPLVVAGMALALTAWAASTHLKPNHPDQYVVEKGDTLWDISARFLTKPWYWPEIWQANPQVENPHLIYPGDVLNLSYDHGPTVTLKPSVHEGKAPVPAIPVARLAPFLEDMRVIDEDALEDSPYVMAFEDNELRGTQGNYAYVRQLNAQPGQKYAIVRPNHVFRRFGDDEVGHTLNSTAEMLSGPWKEDFRNDGHYGHGDMLGIEVQVIGTAQVVKTGDPASLLVRDASMEIRKGDRLLPVDDDPYDAQYFPHPPEHKPDDGRVIALNGALDAVGQRQVVALSVGSNDGIDNGTTFTLSKPGERVHDDVSGNGFHRSLPEHVKLPDEYVGHVMVFRTFADVSYGLVMDSRRPVKLGTKLKMPE